MAAITRLSVDGYGSRRAGSFAGKVASVIVLESNSGGSYIRLPDYRRGKKKDKEPELIEPVETPVEIEIVKRYYSPDTNELSPQTTSLVSAMLQRQIKEISRRNSEETRWLLMYKIRARAALLAA